MYVQENGRASLLRVSQPLRRYTCMYVQEDEGASLLRVSQPLRRSGSL